MKNKHPDQPLIKDEYGTIRFKENKIVDFLVHNFPGGLNEIAIMDFPEEDYQQLMQLIGYSVGGYCELSRISEKSKNKAWKKMLKPP